jgi:hypothetical protein
VVLVHLVLLVHLVVILIFFSLFLQFVLLQRIVDIYVCILRKELFVPEDGGAPVGCFGLSKAHGGKEPAAFDSPAGRGGHAGLAGRADGYFSFFSSSEKAF